VTASNTKSISIVLRFIDVTPFGNRNVSEVASSFVVPVGFRNR
jgi:hypothetical protein